MKFKEHYKSSLESVMQTYPELYKKDEMKIKHLLLKIHKTLDANFDANSPEPLLHRETTHHQEGIEEIVNTLSKRFGKEYEEIILQEASRHVIDDMGQLYTKADYQRPYFWDKWKFMNEDITAWI